MLTDRDSPMKLCFILIYCIIPFDRKLFSVTVPGLCVCYTCSTEADYNYTS